MEYVHNILKLLLISTLYSGSKVGSLLVSKEFLKEINLLHKDTRSGAAIIASKSLSILQKECKKAGEGFNLEILRKAIQLLLKTHPMASLENALIPIYVQFEQVIKNREIVNKNIYKLLNTIFDAHREQMKVLEEKTIETLYKYLREKESILTFSHSSTISSAIMNLSKNGYCDKEIYVLESRPLKEGEKTAMLLSKLGFNKIHLGIDFAVKEFVDKVDLALLGADTIYPDGTILNKIGSATIAELCHYSSKEVIVAASSSKISLLSIKTDKAYPGIPNRNPREISSRSDSKVKIWNRYFELVDSKFISTLILNGNSFSSPIIQPLTEFIKSKNLDSLANSFRD